MGPRTDLFEEISLSASLVIHSVSRRGRGGQNHNIIQLRALFLDLEQIVAHYGLKDSSTTSACTILSLGCCDSGVGRSMLLLAGRELHFSSETVA